MHINQFKKPFRNKMYNLTSSLKMKLSCFGSALMRALCPFESSVMGGYEKNRDKIKSAIFYFTLSFFLGLSKLNIGMRPFGLAILCSTSGRSVVFSFCGAALSSLFEGTGGLIQFITFFLIFLLRKNITGGEFNEGMLPRLITSFFTACFIGACTLFNDGLSGGTVLSYITYIFLSVCCVFLFSGALSEKIDNISNSYRLLSVYSLCVCLIPAFNRITFSGIDFGLMLSCIMCLWICRSKGPVYGCVAGFIFGFACVNPLYSAPIGISCLVSAYLMTKSFYPAVLSFPVCSFFVYSYLFGLSEAEKFIPFTVAGTLIYLAVSEKLPSLSFSEKVTAKKDKRSRYNNSEFEKVSDSLSGLSAVLYKFAEHMKSPGNAETGSIIDGAFCEVCKGCSMNEMCYAKRECNFPHVRSKLISTLHSRKLSEEELSAHLLHKCIKIKELCNYINLHYSDLHFLTQKSNRTQTVAGLYNSISHLLRTTSKNEEEKRSRDERLEKTLSDALGKIGVEFSSITANGKRDKEIQIHGIRADKIPCSAKELADYLSGECRIRLGEPTFDISNNANLIMKLSRKDIISIDYAQCCEAKADESVNGDTVCFFENDKGYFYAVIADGMGSGKTAAATSRLSCVFLQKMLSAGSSIGVCIEMLNNLLLSKNDETFSGIDLLEIDKLQGSACFIKAGAAPSFVLRKTRLYKICSETPPVGIIPAFSAESTKFSLEKGDVIFMVSDGVMESDADAVWLSELIDGNSQNEPAYLAKRLIDKAVEIGKMRDDASVCVIRIN